MDAITIISLILVVLGVIGSIIPVMPGPLLGYIGLLLQFFSGTAENIPVSAVVVFGLAMILVTVIDYLAPVLGAKYFGATKYGIWGAVAGAVLGIIFFPPLGIFIGAFFGAVAGEVAGGKKLPEALRSGAGSLMGSVSVIVIQLIYSLVLAAYFFSRVF